MDRDDHRKLSSHTKSPEGHRRKTNKWEQLSSRLSPPCLVRCAAVVVGVRGCRDIIFEEAFRYYWGGDRMAGPTVLAQSCLPHPSLIQIHLNWNVRAVAGLRGYRTKTQIYGQIRPLQLRS